MLNSNYLPVWSLFKKEVLRFIKVGIQTIIGPAVSSLLFLAVFTLALGKSIKTINHKFKNKSVLELLFIIK